MSVPRTGTSAPGASDAPKRRLVVGLGNDILTDDAVGLRIVRQLRTQLPESPSFQVRELCEMGLSLLDEIVGFDEVVLVDAVQTGEASPGFLHEVDANELKLLPTRLPHRFGIGEVLALGRQLGLAVPSRVRVLAVEVADPFTVATEMTCALTQALPRLVQQVVAALSDVPPVRDSGGHACKRSLDPERTEG